jgi:hypothetical protein
MNGVKGLFVAAYVVAALAGVVFWFADRSVLEASGLEDAFAENLTALLYFMAALLTLSAFVSSRSGTGRFFNIGTTGNVWLLLLAAFFFVCFGEEVSWGQRIFGWGTPEAWTELNGHHETNLHNLLDHAQLGNERLLTLIALSYGVVLPFLNLWSPRMRSFIEWTGVPVPPIELSGLFVLTFVVYRILRFYYPVELSAIAKPIREYHEAAYSAAYLCVAFSFFLKYWGRNRRVEDSTSALVA